MNALSDAELSWGLVGIGSWYNPIDRNYYQSYFSLVARAETILEPLYGTFILL